jgi:hypothetical protein
MCKRLEHHFLATPIAVAGEPVELCRSELVEFPRTKVAGPDPCGPLLFADAELAGDTRGNQARKFVLQREHVTQPAVEPL